MFHLGPLYGGHNESRKYAHFFWRSLWKSTSGSLRSARMFDPARYFAFGTRRDFAEVTRQEIEDIKTAMNAARIAFLEHGGMRLSGPDTDMRSALSHLSLLGGYRSVHVMDSRQVTAAVRDAVEHGELIFVPEREALRECVKAIQEDREKRPAPVAQQRQGENPYGTVQQMMGKPPRVPSGLNTPPGDAQPFDYQPDIPDGDTEQLAASTSNPDYAAKMLGYDRETFGKMIHVMKDDLDLRGDDNVVWHGNGDIEFRKNIIGNMHDYAF